MVMTDLMRIEVRFGSDCTQTYNHANMLTRTVGLSTSASPPPPHTQTLQTCWGPGSVNTGLFVAKVDKGDELFKSEENFDFRFRTDLTVDRRCFVVRAPLLNFVWTYNRVRSYQCSFVVRTSSETCVVHSSVSYTDFFVFTVRGILRIFWSKIHGLC